MGQKTNPNILRLGITKHWKTEFFEKKKKRVAIIYLQRFRNTKLY
jgi:hypothetical protein